MSIDHNSEAVIKTVDVQQSLIARMSASSSAVKNWCLTTTTGVVMFAIEKNREVFLWVALIPILLFAALDIYYLSLEKRVRVRYESLASKVRTERLDLSDLFDVNPGPLKFRDTLSAAISISVWPFYFFLVFALFVALSILKAS
jgi:hypothetical protein